MQGALVTVLADPTHRERWGQYCQASWQAYARRHGLDLLVIPSLIDATDRGRGRSPAWQKLLTGRVPELRRYRQIAWLDADILINADRAPCIFDYVASGKVGAVRSHAFFESPLVADPFHHVCGPFPSTADYNRAVYSQNGLSADNPLYLNTGVLAFTDFDLGWLEQVYHGHDPLPCSFHEQVFLSHALVNAGLTWELDPRFNVEWYALKSSVYDFAGAASPELKRECLRQALALSYFLNLAGNQHDLALLDARPAAPETRPLAPDPPWRGAAQSRRQRLTEAVFDATGGLVQRGPFRGMRIRPEVTWGDGDFASKLLGFYEEELHPEFVGVIARRYPTVAVVGCAEGFYAVGLALRMGETRVVAFDTSAAARRVCRANAELNGVSGRIDIHAECTTGELNRLLAEVDEAFLLVDCEGAERELLDPAAVPGLVRCDFIVECHDFIDRRITGELQSRFQATHEVVLVREGARDPNASDVLRRLSSLDRWLTVSEQRPECMHWLVGRRLDGRLELDKPVADHTP